MGAFTGWTAEQTLTAIALVGAVVAFGIGLWQYGKAQQWKRAEWVAQEAKELFDNPVIQAVFLMIDWSKRRIPLYPHQTDDVRRYVLLNDEIITRALMLHRDRPEGFSEIEADIRSAFDQLLDGLERFNSYVETGLVSDDDLVPYLRYWATRVAGAPEAIKEKRLAQLDEYMHGYGYAGAYQLLSRIASKQRATRHLVRPTLPEGRLEDVVEKA